MSTSTPYTIRDARPEDRAAARTLTLTAYGRYAEIMAPEAWAGLEQAVRAALTAEGPFEQFVAEQAGAIVGSVFLFPAGGDPAKAGGRMIWPELRLLAVDSAARGQGIGRALIAACIERARANGAPALGLYSSASMREALALYERFGFTRMPAYDFQPPGAELIMAFAMEF
jgi:predicted N-acetyltransferase YhbS